MSKTQDTPKRLKLPKYINKTRFYRIEREAFPEEWQNIPKILAQIYGTWIIVDSKQTKQKRRN